MRDKIKKPLRVVAAVLFWLVLWEVLSLVIRQEIVLPSPVQVAVTLAHMVQTGDFWISVAVSMGRVLLGFAAGLAAGTLLAIATERVRLLAALFEPLLHVIRAAPVASFIILAYVWVNVSSLPSVIAFLMVLPLTWGNIRQGIAHTDRSLLEMAHSFRFGRRKTLRYVWWPSVKPYFSAACTTGMGFAWKSGIAAEVICAPPQAIGTGLKNAKVYLETPEVFAWTVTVVLLSLGLERLFGRLMRTHGEVTV